MINAQGKTGARLLIFVAIVAIVLWVLFSLMPTWWQAQQFKDHLKNLASYGGAWPFSQDDVMADSMARAAKEAKVPELTKDYFLRNLKRSGGVVQVKVHYERSCVLLGTGSKIKNYVFDWNIGESVVGP